MIVPGRVNGGPPFRRRFEIAIPVWGSWTADCGPWTVDSSSWPVRRESDIASSVGLLWPTTVEIDAFGSFRGLTLIHRARETLVACGPCMWEKQPVVGGS